MALGLPLPAEQNMHAFLTLKQVHRQTQHDQGMSFYVAESTSVVCLHALLRHGSGAALIPVLFDESHALKGTLQMVHIGSQLHQLHI